LGFVDVKSAGRDLGYRRWLAAALCVAAGVLGAGLVGQLASDTLYPARITAIQPADKAPAVTTAEILKETQRHLIAPNALRKTLYDLNLAELGLSGDVGPEALLASAITVSQAEMPAVIDIAVKSGDVRVDGIIANYLAASLVSSERRPDAATDASEVRPADDTAASNSSTPLHYKLVAKARVVQAPSMWVYQAEIIALAILSALSVVAFGLARKLRSVVARPIAVPVAPKPVAPRGILEQIDMLERMWPETGRANPLPEGSNDEPDQQQLKPARRIVLRMGELRQEAREAIEGPSEEALENVLTDMQSLRDQVRWITAEQLRQRRLGMR
jgi:hypothetical protein